MSKSHTNDGAKSRLTILPELGLVDLNQTGLAERLAGKVSEQLENFAAHMRQGLLAASVAIGLDVMGEFMDADVTEMAGPKGKHDPSRTAYRHGTDDGTVTLGGRRVDIRRPRVRSVEGAEVRLESYDVFASVTCSPATPSPPCWPDSRRAAPRRRWSRSAIRSMRHRRRRRAPRCRAGSWPPPPNAWPSSGRLRWATGAS